MNNARVWRLTNAFLIACGYQLHRYDAKTSTYQLSVLAVVNLIALLLCYVICFNQHFEESSLLQMLADLSPFLRRLVRVQLLLGLQVMLLLGYEMKHVMASARQLARLLATTQAHMTTARFTRHECAAYALLYMPFCIICALVLYIGYQMEFKLPPMEHIFVGMALFLPHYMLAGAVRHFCITNWLLQRRMHFNTKTMQQMLVPLPSSQGVTNVVLVPLQEFMAAVKLQLLDMASKQAELCKAVRLQLIALFALNCNCLLAASYSLLYFENIWHVLFATRTTRVFYAANVGVYVLICCDYLCIGLVQYCCNNSREQLQRLIDASLQDTASNWLKATRQCLKHAKATLSAGFKFGILEVASYKFLLLQMLVALAIALFITHSYLDEQINLLASRLDSDENK